MEIRTKVFLKWFVVIPLILLGFHLGIIVTHIALEFIFEIPIFIRISGILTGSWVLLSIYLMAKKEKFNI